MRLKGKTAVVTGGVGNIGLAVVRRFVEEGARVALVDRDAESVAAIVEAANDQNLIGLAADVTREADVARYAADACAKFGAIDIFFNNAGIAGPVRPLPELAVEDFDAVMAVNVRGVFLGLKHVLPIMSDGGSVIVTSSVAGLHGARNISPYSASKHAVMGLVKSAAMEAAARGIRVNAINPGPVEGQMMRELEDGLSPGDPARTRESIARGMPLGRYLQTREVADLVLFLASDDSRMITGSAHVIDSGLTL